MSDERYRKAMVARVMMVLFIGAPVVVYNVTHSFWLTGLAEILAFILIIGLTDGGSNRNARN